MERVDQTRNSAAVYAAILAAAVFLGAGGMVQPVIAGDEDAASQGPPEGETGTDPRDFAPKFMPYYRYTELENGLEQNDVTLFGLYAFNQKFAVTYEIPLVSHRDVGDTALFDPGTGECAGSLGGGSPTLPNGLAAEGDCKETGVGDMNLRFLYRTDYSFLNADWIVGAEFDFPTATDDTLGSETLRCPAGAETGDGAGPFAVGPIEKRHRVAGFQPEDVAQKSPEGSVRRRMM